MCESDFWGLGVKGPFRHAVWDFIIHLSPSCMNLLSNKCRFSSNLLKTTVPSLTLPYSNPPADSSCPHPVWAHMVGLWRGDISIHFSSPSSSSFSSSYLSPAVPVKPVRYVFPVSSLASKHKRMVEKKKTMREREWVSASGMGFAVCSVFTACGFIRLSAGLRARLNGHHCPVWAPNLVSAPHPSCLSPLLLAVLECCCQ